MKLLFLEDGWDDYQYWQDKDPAIVRRINALLKDAMRDPFRGIGKPEPLKRELAGWWSRRITAEHRLIYLCEGKGEDQRIVIFQCRFHY